MKFLNQEIKTKEDIKNYVHQLTINDMLYFFGEPAENMITRDPSEPNEYVPSFTPEQCELLNKRRAEMYAIDEDYMWHRSMIEMNRYYLIED